MGIKSTITEKDRELIKLALLKAMIRLNNEVLLSTGFEMTDKYKEIILTTNVLDNQENA